MLATVFTSHGGYVSPQAFVHGLTPAMWVGTAVLAAGALIALVLPFDSRATGWRRPRSRPPSASRQPRNRPR